MTFQARFPLVVAGALSLSLATACGSAPVQAASADTLTDAAIVAYDAKPFDRRAMMFKHIVLGVHHGAHVVADFPCSDLCPDYTTRIIHYDVDPGPACTAIGGAEVTRVVPVSIAVNRQPFCVPKVLADKG